MGRVDQPVAVASAQVSTVNGMALEGWWTRSLTEWGVLALVTEGPTHGFAVSRLTAPTGPIGKVWQVPRPRVYRTLDRLVELSLIEPSGTEPGRGGPERTLLAVTAPRRSAVDARLMQTARR